MDFSNFLMMRQEMGLLAIFLILLIYDIFASETGAMKWFRPLAIVLLAAHTAMGFLSMPEGSAFGGMYVTSGLTVMMKNILNIAALIVLMQAGEWLRGESNRIREGEYYVLMASTLFGMYLMVSAGNFMLLYLGIELASLPAACLAAYNKYKEKSAEAGAKYILMAALSSGVMLFGLSYLYGATGSMYFTDMSANMAVDTMTVFGFVFFFAGLAFKISLVPFHTWAPDVYEGSPTATTAYFSVISKAAAVFALMLTLHHVFGELGKIWYYMLWVLTVVTIVVGNLLAIRQKDIKRFFAYSSISQAGFILLGVLHGSEAGLTATIYFILVYLFSNLAAFGVIAAVEHRSGRTDIDSYNGLYKSNPKLALVMMLAVFSLAGIPPLAGFFSKFFIFSAAAREGDYVLVFIATVNTVISLYYYLRIIKAMFINAPEEGAVPHFRTDTYNRISLVICTIAMIAVGIFSGVYNFMGGTGFFA
jgi:NADH-quinone oxidoreductase subunit N